MSNTATKPIQPKRKLRSVAPKTTEQTKLEPISSQPPLNPPIHPEPSSTPLLDQVTQNMRERVQPLAMADTNQPDAFVVDYLPDFLIDHRTDLNARRIPCGEVTGLEGIREEIQLRFVPKVGAGHFRIVARLRGKPTGLRWVEFVDAPLRAKLPAISEAPTDTDEDDDGWLDDEPDESLVPLHEWKRMSAENTRLQVELERLRTREAMRDEMRQEVARMMPKGNSSGGSLSELASLKALDDLRGQRETAPIEKPKSLIEQLKELKAAQELLAPATTNAAPSTDAASGIGALVQAIVKNPSDDPQEQAANLALLRTVLGVGDEGDDYDEAPTDSGLMGLLQSLVSNPMLAPIIAQYAAALLPTVQGVATATSPTPQPHQAAAPVRPPARPMRRRPAPARQVRPVTPSQPDA